MLGKSHVVHRKGSRQPCEMAILILIIIFPTGVICSKGLVVIDTVEAFNRSQCKTQRAIKRRKYRNEVIFLAVNVWSVVSQEKNPSCLTPTARLILPNCACSLQSYPLWDKSSRNWVGTSQGQFHAKKQVVSPAGELLQNSESMQNFKAIAYR